MNTNDTNKIDGKIIYPELSYAIVGICFEIHNRLGRFSREKQYCDFLERKLQEIHVPYEREYTIGKTGNRVDFLIDGKLILEVKAKRFVLKQDFYQLQRYLQISGKKLGLIVNFRNRYLKPIRIIRIDTTSGKKFL
jgi:GxxExxY protein